MTRPYRAPNKRTIRRAGDGRFRRTTLRDVGIAVVTCEQCGGFNPHGMAPGDPKPTTCEQCGAPLGTPAEADEEREDGEAKGGTA